MKTVMLLDPPKPVRVSDEEAFQIVERDGEGYYVDKSTYKRWVKAQKEEGTHE